MRQITEVEAMRHISISRNLPIHTAAIRLWAIAQLFYRQPVGEHALVELHNRIGDEATGVLFYVTGFLMERIESIDPDFSGLLPSLDGEPK